MLLLYSGGLDTSVMLKWIQERYGAEIVTLTVEPRPARRGLGRRHRQGRGARRRRDGRRRRARGVRRALRAAAIKANALYGGGYPLFTALGRPLIAKLAVRGRPRARLRHDRPRLHRQGQRPGPDRGHDRDARPRAEGDRARARVADGPRGGDRLRPRARDPGQGRHRGLAVLDRRQPLGALLGGPRDRGPGGAAARRRLPARHAARAGARRGRAGPGRVRARRARSRWTASGSAWSS